MMRNLLCETNATVRAGIPATTADRTPPETLLEPVASFKASGAEEFAATERFILDAPKGARVRIAWLGENFKFAMLPKRERRIAGGELKLKKLKHASFSAPIIAEMGGEEKAEVSLCEFYETLAHKQAIRDFRWVVGFVRGANGTFWAVRGGRFDDGWDIEASFIGYPYLWHAANEFVSR